MGLDPDHLYKYPHEFSGVGVKELLWQDGVLKPKLLILDEPTALDSSIQIQVIELLQKIQLVRYYLYFYDHDLQVIRAVSDIYWLCKMEK